MKRHLLTLFIILFGQIVMAQRYNLYIKNDVNEWIPVRMGFNHENLEVYNAEETIQLPLYAKRGDTLIYHFIDYNAEIAIVKGENSIYSGYWINFESAVAKKREIFAYPDFSKSPDKNIAPELFSGRWKASILSNGREIPALMILTQKQDKIYGTIRTNSGDYRYLEGLVDGDEFYLSSFGGNSVFSLSCKLDKVTGEITGIFHNITTNNTGFKAIKDDKYDLPNAETLTKIANDLPFNLNLKDEKGIQQNFEELTKDKVTLISIFGTWCPNCVDETNYFNNELIKKFPTLKIITVAYEATDNEMEQQKRVQGFIQRKNIQGIQFLIAKKASEAHVRENFPMIDSFHGYPTTFLVDKNGKLIAIHTGFNGPATGILYNQYKENLEFKIKTLLK